MVECVCTRASDCGVIWVLSERERERERGGIPACKAYAFIFKL